MAAPPAATETAATAGSLQYQPTPFVEKCIDIIGCLPDEPDSVLREIFSPAGDIAWVTRWSSAAQKHHAFIGFKDPQSAIKALSLPLPRTPERDWRLSRLNPDLKARVIELLPKYISVKVKVDEANLDRLAETRAQAEKAQEAAEELAARNGDGPREANGSSGAPLSPYRDNGAGINRPGGGRSDPSYLPYGPEGSNTGAPYRDGPGPSLRPEGAWSPRLNPNPDYNDTPRRPLNDNRFGQRTPSPPLGSWNRDARTGSPTYSPGGHRALPSKPYASEARAENGPRIPYAPRPQQTLDPRDRGRIVDRRRSPPPPPNRGPIRRPYSPPPRVGDRDRQIPPRRDARFDGRDAAWTRGNNNINNRDPRSRSPSTEGAAERGRSASPRSRDYRAPPTLRDARPGNSTGVDYRRTRDGAPPHRSGSPTPSMQSLVADNTPSNPLKALNDFLAPYRSITPGGTVNIDAQLGAPTAIEVLCKFRAPVTYWVQIASQFMRRSQFDLAEQVALAGLEMAQREPATGLGNVNPLYYVLANINTSRSRQFPHNSADAQKWLVKATDWLRQAQASSTDAGAVTNLSWLAKDMATRPAPPSGPLSAVAGGVPSALPDVTRNDGPIVSAATDSYERFEEAQSKHQHAVAELKAEQAERQRLEERVKTLEKLLQEADARAQEAQSGHSQGPSISEEKDKRLIALLGEERLAKRKAEDQVEEERTKRRKCEDELWKLGQGSVIL